MSLRVSAVCNSASLRKTVKTIQTHPLIPRDVTVRGFIIDSVTGALEEIN